MRVVQPHWVSHDGMPIFSIDIHPDNSRFATGGQGKDSGLVAIWNFAPIISENSEVDVNVHKMLCYIDSHLACVNCVRWSGSGKYLASGGDDKLVMIWKFAKYPQGGNTVFGSKGKVNSETWRCVYTLRAHSGDILDLAWSPQDLFLATASVDNTIIIWDASKLPEIVTVLKGHTGLVKGVTWDPIGKYLSSQSEDKSLRIWRTLDWQIETVIMKPFEKCSGTTAVLRHSWSPDGQYLVTAHSMNNSGPTSQIIERTGWKHDKDYVGHRKAVTCVRFSSNMVQRKSKHSNKIQQMCVCALGSRDNGISVWLTGLIRPLVVLESVFQGPVLDLSWSSNGIYLLACSYDGSVTACIFSESEIGKPLTPEQRDKVYETVYGTSSIGNHQTLLVENPDILSFIEDAEKRQKVENDHCDLKAATPTKYNIPITTKQIETRTADGRRRITPIFIPPTFDNGQVNSFKMDNGLEASSNMKSSYFNGEEINKDGYYHKFKNIEENSSNKIFIRGEKGSTQSNIENGQGFCNNTPVPQNVNGTAEPPCISDDKKNANRRSSSSSITDSSLSSTSVVSENEDGLLDVSSIPVTIADDFPVGSSNTPCDKTIACDNHKSMNSFDIPETNAVKCDLPVLDKDDQFTLVPRSGNEVDAQKYLTDDDKIVHNSSPDVPVISDVIKSIQEKDDKINCCPISDDKICDASGEMSNANMLEVKLFPTDTITKWKEGKTHEPEIAMEVEETSQNKIIVKETAVVTSVKVTVTDSVLTTTPLPRALEMTNHLLSDVEMVDQSVFGGAFTDTDHQHDTKEPTTSSSTVCSSMDTECTSVTPDILDCKLVTNVSNMVETVLVTSGKPKSVKATPSNELSKPNSVTTNLVSNGNLSSVKVAPDNGSSSKPNSAASEGTLGLKVALSNDSSSKTNAALIESTLNEKSNSVKVIPSNGSSIKPNSVGTEKTLDIKSDLGIVIASNAVSSNPDASPSETTTATKSVLGKVDLSNKLPSKLDSPATESSSNVKSVSIRKRSNGVINLLAAKRPKFLDKNFRDSIHSKQEETEKLNAVTSDESLNKNICLPAMQVNIPLVVSLPFMCKMLIVNEIIPSMRGSFSRLKLKSNDVLLWEYLFGTVIIGYCFNENLIAVAADNMSLHVLELKTGKFVFPPINLSGKTSHLLMNNSHLLCITTNGCLNVWDITNMRSIIIGQSMLSIVPSGPSNISIKKLMFSTNGFPMVVLSNGKSFIFSADLSTWLLVGDNLNPIVSHSSQQVRHNAMRGIIQEGNKLPLYSLQCYLSSSASAKVCPSTDLNNVCTLTFLEQQVATCISLKSPVEYRHWLLALVRFLLQQGETRRLRNICEELMGPVHKHGNYKDTILGLSKHSLLRNVLKEIGGNIQMQRLFTEFYDQLNLVSPNT